MRIRRPPVVAAAILALATGASLGSVAPPATLAFLFDSATAVATFTTDGLDPPTSLSATPGATVALAWTVTPDAYATGYQVLRSTTSGSGYSQVGTATPQSATAYTDTPAGAGTYYYVLRSYYQNWTSVDSNEASAAYAPGTGTGFKDCTSQAAETSAGDNNGYEVSPGNACADDNAEASDVDSGTNPATSCTNSNKDKHRFWGYAFGLPGSVTAITSIDVRAGIRVDATSGTNRLCARLSWDAGTTWTSTQQVDLTSTAEQTVTMTGLWGRGWTLSELSTTNFRVQLVDVSGTSTRDFYLDYVAVQVVYTP
ncbi:MAG TPA: hypothetical protein VIH00_01300 [Candidatus Limnocylindrales bacterium]